MCQSCMETSLCGTALDSGLFLRMNILIKKNIKTQLYKKETNKIPWGLSGWSLNLPEKHASTPLQGVRVKCKVTFITLYGL